LSSTTEGNAAYIEVIRERSEYKKKEETKWSKPSVSISEVKRKRKIIKLQELFPRRKTKFSSEEIASVTFTVENMKIFLLTFAPCFSS